MKRKLAVILALAMLFFVTLAFAQSGSDYDLTWNTIDSGGGASAGGNYSLMGTLGQPDAGALGGGGYALAGGFWGGVGAGPAPTQYPIYLPVVLRQ